MLFRKDRTSGRKQCERARILIIGLYNFPLFAKSGSRSRPYRWRISIYRYRNLLRGISRPPWRFRSTDLGVSVNRLGVPRSTDSAISVDRPRHFGRSARPTGSTDIADAVDRVCSPTGDPSVTKRRGSAWVIDPPLRNLCFACQIFRRRSYISVKGEYDDEHAI